jgi:hypothetical protein
VFIQLPMLPTSTPARWSWTEGPGSNHHLDPPLEAGCYGGTDRRVGGGGVTPDGVTAASEVIEIINKNLDHTSYCRPDLLWQGQL